MKSPAVFLREGAEMFEQRAKVYGDNWRTIGAVMAGLFPDGLSVRTEDDWNRLHLFLLMAVKMTRYANNFRDGHQDSVHDSMVYAAMLEAYDERLKDQEVPF